MDTDKIIEYDNGKSPANILGTDFKAEVVASGLKEKGYDPERTLIIRQSDSKRGYSKDIECTNRVFPIRYDRLSAYICKPKKYI